MRLSMITVCLLLGSPSRALACIEHNPEQTGWFHEMALSHRGFAAEGAEETGMLGVWLVGAGSSSLALIVVSFRGLSRGSSRGRIQPAEIVPADLPIRIDAGHARPEPIRAGRAEATFSQVLELPEAAGH